MSKKIISPGEIISIKYKFEALDVIPYNEVYEKHYQIIDLEAEIEDYEDTIDGVYDAEETYVSILEEKKLRLLAEYEHDVGQPYEDKCKKTAKNFRIIFNIIYAIAIIVSLILSAGLIFLKNIDAFGLFCGILSIAFPATLWAGIINFIGGSWKGFCKFEMILLGIVSFLEVILSVNLVLILIFGAVYIFLIVVFSIIKEKAVLKRVSNKREKKLAAYKNSNEYKLKVEEQEQIAREEEKIKRQIWEKEKNKAYLELPKLQVKIEKLKAAFNEGGYSEWYDLFSGIIELAKLTKIPNLPLYDEEIIAGIIGFVPVNKEASCVTLIYDALDAYQANQELCDNMIKELASDMANLITGKR